MNTVFELKSYPGSRLHRKRVLSSGSWQMVFIEATGPYREEDVVVCFPHELKEVLPNSPAVDIVCPPVPVKPKINPAWSPGPVIGLQYKSHEEELTTEDRFFLIAALQHYSRVPYSSTRARCIAMIKRLGGEFRS